VPVRPDTPPPIARRAGQANPWSDVALLVIVYHNDPADFERDHRALEAIRDKLWIGHPRASTHRDAMGTGRVIFPDGSVALATALARHQPERVEARLLGGRVLRGQVASVDHGRIWFEDESDGLVAVAPSSVQEVRLAPSIEVEDDASPPGPDAAPVVVQWRRGDDAARLAAHAGDECDVLLTNGERVTGVLVGATETVIVVRDGSAQLQTLAVSAVDAMTLVAAHPSEEDE